MLTALETSLQRLQTDYIDLWQLHAWDPVTPLEETLSALDSAVSSGKVRYVGISNFSGWQTAKAATYQASWPGRAALVSTQMEYSLLARGVEREVVPAAQDLGLGLIPWSPLGRGVLTGKYRGGIPSDSRGAAEDYQRFVRAYLDEGSSRIVDALLTAADGLGVSPIAVALAWVRDRPGVVAPDRRRPHPCPARRVARGRGRRAAGGDPRSVGRRVRARQRLPGALAGVGLAGSPEASSVELLLGPEGNAVLEAAASVGDSLKAGETLRRTWPADLVAAAMTQVELRSRASSKFPAADRMLFTRAGLEQASSAPVSTHRAARFASYTRVVDLCCGIGGDLIGLASVVPDVLAVDRDPVHLQLARHNVEALGLRVRTWLGDAEAADLTGIEAAFVDPARRTGAQRLSDGSPSLAWCIALAGRLPVGVKAAPGIDHQLVPEGWELEFVAVGGAAQGSGSLVAGHGDGGSPGDRDRRHRRSTRCPAEQHNRRESASRETTCLTPARPSPVPASSPNWRPGCMPGSSTR